jgi:hypothetical protein
MTVVMPEGFEDEQPEEVAPQALAEKGVVVLSNSKEYRIHTATGYTVDEKNLLQITKGHDVVATFNYWECAFMWGYPNSAEFHVSERDL